MSESNETDFLDSNGLDFLDDVDLIEYWYGWNVPFPRCRWTVHSVNVDNREFVTGLAPNGKSVHIDLGKRWDQ